MNHEGRQDENKSAKNAERAEVAISFDHGYYCKKNLKRGRVESPERSFSEDDQTNKNETSANNQKIDGLTVATTFK